MTNSKTQAEFERISFQTAEDLKSIAQSLMADDLSSLSLPEIEQLSDIVARILPAGNIPSLIVSGLARLPGRKAPRDVIQRDIDILFDGINQTLEKAVYSTFFAGPAAVIWGYQNLMKLAGKDARDSFPNGTWQFYVDYAMREDSARHTNETHGFQTTLDKYDLQLDRSMRITALVMGAINIICEYDALLENEWRERVYTSILSEVTQQTNLQSEVLQVYRQWEKQRPYRRDRDARADETYPMYRRRKFDEFLETVLESLPLHLQSTWLTHIRQAKQEDVTTYQRQMSIHGYLLPKEHHEIHVPLSLDKLHIGLIYEGRYYLIPITQSYSHQINTVDTVHSLINDIFQQSATTLATSLQDIALLKRAKQNTVFARMDESLVSSLHLLRYTPIIINCDQISSDQPLSQIRQTERGIGHHALTIFDTQKTLVFDQSHIYFDGAWGVALAEIYTNEALSWAVYLQQAELQKINIAPIKPLELRLSANDKKLINSYPRVTQEIGVENDEIDLKRLLALRRMFKQRSDLLQLTVNDLLVLYRAIHAITYTPPDNIVEQLEIIKSSNANYAAQLALETIYNRQNPAILIPVDASVGEPRDRLHPMSFEVPLADLNLLNAHKQVLLALYRYKSGKGSRDQNYEIFHSTQHEYLAILAAFGAVLSRAKDIAIRGESASVGTIKLLAHLPPSLQRLLDGVPGRFDVLNDIIKGNEVFSNVGAVVPSSTLTRFVTAKDDNDKKMLAWGVMTDAKGVMKISLRDFRPHVGALQSAGYEKLAYQIADSYLASYVTGFNQYINELQQITRASRETRMNIGDD